MKTSTDHERLCFNLYPLHFNLLILSVTLTLSRQTMLELVTFIILLRYDAGVGGLCDHAPQCRAQRDLADCDAFSVGGIFLLQHAEFLFAVQIILYVGGIMVLFLFVVMLVDIDVALKQARFARQWPVALVTAVLVLGLSAMRCTTMDMDSNFLPVRWEALPRRTLRRWAWLFIRITCCRWRLLRYCCWWRWSAP